MDESTCKIIPELFDELDRVHKLSGRMGEAQVEAMKCIMNPNSTVEEQQEQVKKLKLYVEPKES